MREYRLKSPGQPGGLIPDGLPEAAPNGSTGVSPVRFAAGLPATVPPPTPAPALPPRQPRSAGAAPAPAPARKAPGGPLLSLNQKAKIGSAAALAYKAHLTADPDWLADMLQLPGNNKTKLAENWRHSQVAHATRTHPAGQVTGLSHARNAHYNTLLAHFCALAGLDSESFTATMRDSTSATTGETADDFRQGKHALEQAMQATGFGWNYVMKCVKRKHHTTRLEDLTRQQLQHLSYTLHNRHRSQKYKTNTWKPGEKPTGPECRNKKQSATRHQPPAPDNVIPLDFTPR
jgi:hypothetical protein